MAEKLQTIHEGASDEQMWWLKVQQTKQKGRKTKTNPAKKLINEV